MSKQKILSQKVILTTDKFCVYEVEIEAANGKRYTYQNVLRDDAVSVFPLSDTNELYLVRQYRFIHKKHMLEAVAGFIENDKTPHETAAAELAEEAGFRADTLKKIAVIDAAGSVINWKQHLFLAKGLHEVNTHHEPLEEGLKLIKMSIQKAILCILSGEISCASTISGILLIDQMVKEGKI